jgi:TRAP-type C4-dicarboxylate transport system permease small subunit
MKAVRSVINIFIYIAVAAIVVMLAITFLDVVFRLLFARPIVGATEVCEILMAVMLTAMGGSLLAGKTVQVDVMLDALPRKASFTIDRIVLIITAAYCFLVGYSTILNGRFSMVSSRSYTFIGVPQWPFLMLLGFSFLLAGFATVLATIILCQNKNKTKNVLENADLAILQEVDT